MAPKDDMIQALRERFGEHAMDAPAGAWDAISSQLALGAAASTDLFAEFFHDRFEAHEAAVDPGVWDSIQNSLSNAPADPVNELLRNRFNGHEVQVPAGAWEAISGQLVQGVTAGTGLSAGWLAASLAGLAGIGALVWQLGGTEPTPVPQAATSAIERTTAPANALVREERPASTSDVSSGTGRAAATVEVAALKAAIVQPPAATEAISAPEAGPSSTATNTTSTPIVTGTVAASVEPLVPERMTPNQVAPSQPRLEGRQVVATVLEQMNHPQEVTPQRNDPETEPEPTVDEQEDQPAAHAEELQIFVPNVFSPNGDGENEYWEPMGSGYQRVMVRVFDPANGTLVFRSNDLRPWNGLDMS
ncbi:MAG: gliding motility-associated C-terminal domain-containing protein [Flavobacteriales bacterium]|nr:gliding motility-associated C-terminal domain-containing protein [Flavobacteriales bacterium]